MASERTPNPTEAAPTLSPEKLMLQNAIWGLQQFTQELTHETTLVQLAQEGGPRFAGLLDQYEVAN
jgi:hypothetical protein